MPLKQQVVDYANHEFSEHPQKELIIGMIEAMQAGAQVTRDWFEKARAAEAAGQGRDSVLGVTEKNQDLAKWGYEDVFTQADKDCEATILPMLKALKDIPVISEEDCEQKRKEGIDLMAQSAAEPDGAMRWLVDPIDGTFCFKQGLDDFSITCALQEKVNGQWQTRIGMVAVPMHHEIFMADDKKAYVIQNNRAKPLYIPRESFTAFDGHTRAALLKDKKVEVVVYSKTNDDLNKAGYGMQAELPKAQRSYSSAMVLAKMADGWTDAILLAANALENSWDTDAALHIAEKAGLVLQHKTVAGEPLTIVATSAPLATALCQSLQFAYANQINVGRSSA